MSKLTLKLKKLDTARKNLEDTLEEVKREYVVAIMEALSKKDIKKAEEIIANFISEYGDDYQPVIRQLESIYGVDRIG